MTSIKFPRLPITLASAITLAFASFTSCLLPVGAQFTRSDSTSPSSGRVRVFPLPLSNQKSPDFSGDGRPGRRAGGGSRSPCPERKPPLTALMPMSNMGKTVAERPTFWFYVPYSPQSTPAGEFVLQEENGDEVYRASFTLPKTPGFVSFNIPPTVAPLEIDKSYHWYFKLYCEPQMISAPVFVEGWVQRIELTPELERQLQAAKARENVVYAANGIWYDALDRLAQLRLTNPSSSRNDDWAKLLSSRGVGLELLSRAPIVGRVVLSLPLVSSSSKPITH